MRMVWVLMLCACARELDSIPTDVRWRLVQQEFPDRRIGDAVLRPGPMIFLAPEPGRTDCLAVDPIPSHFEAGETISIRVMIRSQNEAERFQVRVADRSRHLRVEPESFELGRGEIRIVRVTSALPGPAELRLEAFPKGGVQ